MPGLVHPSAFFLYLVQDAGRLAPEGIDVHWGVVVVGNERCRGGQVIEHGVPRPQPRERHPGRLALCIGLLPQDRAVRLDLVAQGQDLVAVAAQLRRDTGHTGPAEPVEDDVARLRVVQDVPHDGLVRYLRMVGVRIVDGVVLAFAHVGSKRLAAVLPVPGLGWFLGLPLVDEVGNPRVRTGRVVRWVGQGDDVLIGPNREALHLLQFWQLCAQFGAVPLPALIVGCKLSAEDNYLALPLFNHGFLHGLLHDDADGRAVLAGEFLVQQTLHAFRELLDSHCLIVSDLVNQFGRRDGDLRHVLERQYDRRYKP